MINTFSKYLLLFLLSLYPLETLCKDNKNSDLIVEADNSIEYFENEKYYLASGNASAFKDGILLNAEIIKAFFKNKTNEIKILIGFNKVSIKNKSIFAKAEKIKYDIEKKTIHLTQGIQIIQTDDINMSTSNYIIFNNKKKEALGEGNVNLELKKDKIKIQSQKIFAVFNKNSNQLEKAKSIGNVIIKTKDEKITSKLANYDKNTNLINLKGEVIIYKQKSKLMGEEGLVNLNTGITKILSKGKNKRIKGKFITSEK